MGAVADDIAQSLLDCSGNRLHGFQGCVDHATVPVLEVGSGISGVGVIPEIAKHFLVGPGFSGLQLKVVDFCQRSNKIGSPANLVNRERDSIRIVLK